ncbi:InlB B-repeat-containing protein, partial [Croceitalea rosinachiae]
SGSGDGTYESGDVVNIVADVAPAGQQFVSWTGDVSGVADINSSSTTVTIPSSDVVVTATYGEVSPGGTIWLEDFEDLSNGDVVDNGATAWSSSRAGGTFEVLDGRFWTNVSGGVGTWTSEVIPIGGTISLSMDVDDSDDNKESSDFVRALYILDGGTPVEFGFVNNDIDPQTFISGEITGSTVQIVVESLVSGGNENYFIDNVAVTTAVAGLRARLDDYALGNTEPVVPFEVMLYPNPATTEATLSVKGNSRLEAIAIFNSLGQQVRAFKASELWNRANGYQLPVYDLPIGAYHLNILNDEGTTFIRQLIIRR